MNIAFYYHALPPVDDMLYLSTTDEKIKPSDIVMGWVDSGINAFIVVGVTDEQIRELYTAVKKRADVAVAQLKNSSKVCGGDAQLKRLYRFDTVTTAKRYIDFLTAYLEDDFDDREDYEDFMRDRIEVWFLYEEPWVFARELTEQDWEPGGLFYEELHSEGCL